MKRINKLLHQIIIFIPFIILTIHADGNIDEVIKSFNAEFTNLSNIKSESDKEDFVRKNWGKFLGFFAKTTQSAITKRYRELARKLHPDRSTLDQEKFQVLGQARDAGIQSVGSSTSDQGTQPKPGPTPDSVRKKQMQYYKIIIKAIGVIEANYDLAKNTQSMTSENSISNSLNIINNYLLDITLPDILADILLKIKTDIELVEFKYFSRSNQQLLIDLLIKAGGPKKTIVTTLEEEKYAGKLNGFIAEFNKIIAGIKATPFEVDNAQAAQVYSIIEEINKLKNILPASHKAKLLQRLNELDFSRFTEATQRNYLNPAIQLMGGAPKAVQQQKTYSGPQIINYIQQLHGFNNSLQNLQQAYV